VGIANYILLQFHVNTNTLRKNPEGICIYTHIEGLRY